VLDWSSKETLAMSRATATALAEPPDFELIHEDEEPLESQWHLWQMGLLIHLLHQWMRERGRGDFFVGGNMFVYYSLRQAQAVAADPAGHKEFKGPDVFYVADVDPHERPSWVVWEEGNRYPDVIFELASPTTRTKDLTTKKDLYAQVFRTPEYFFYDRDRDELRGFRLAGTAYQELRPNVRGRVWSVELGAELGVWRGEHDGVEAPWLRLCRPDGGLVPTARETAEAAQDEVARLRARLAELTGSGRVD
jgi:Uma2 family endonuclease